MKILIAEDESVSRRLLQAALTKWGYEVVTAVNGKEAWAALQAPGAPHVAILDWLMPELDGVEVCRFVRAEPSLRTAYLILLTSRTGKEDLIAGLEAGADDYVTKPFDHGELKARVQVGARIVKLQAELAVRVQELEAALAREQQLQGLLPICCYCKKIRDDGNYWHQVESYIVTHANVKFSHGVCPDCLTKMKAELE